MKVYIEDQGDRSVGIQPVQITVEFPEGFVQDREQMRIDLREFGETQLDAHHVSVWYDDECFDCGQTLDPETKKCVNYRCISNMPDEE